MGTRGPLAPQEIYHVYNRGTEKRTIFTTKKDWDRFVALLHLCNGTKAIRMHDLQGKTFEELLEQDRGEPLVDIGAYCLMPNHFHLLLKQRANNGISKFMQKLITGYTMYFNKKNERSGALFQGKYKSKHAGEDRYLKYLMAYIHLNPNKSARSNLANPAKYSSYADYAGGNRPEGALLGKDAFPLYFPTPADFKKDMRDWLTYRKEFERV